MHHLKQVYDDATAFKLTTTALKVCASERKRKEPAPQDKSG